MPFQHLDVTAGCVLALTAVAEALNGEFNNYILIASASE